MKPRNDSLRAEVERIVNLKLQIPPYKLIAEKHHASLQTVRALVSRLMQERKSTKISIHVERCDGR